MYKKYNILKLKTECDIQKDRNLNEIKMRTFFDNVQDIWDANVKEYQFGRKWAHLNFDKYQDMTDSINIRSNLLWT